MRDDATADEVYSALGAEQRATVDAARAHRRSLAGCKTLVGLTASLTAAAAEALDINVLRTDEKTGTVAVGLFSVPELNGDVVALPTGERICCTCTPSLRAACSVRLPTCCGCCHCFCCYICCYFRCCCPRSSSPCRSPVLHLIWRVCLLLFRDRARLLQTADASRCIGDGKKMILLPSQVNAALEMVDAVASKKQLGVQLSGPNGVGKSASALLTYLLCNCSEPACRLPQRRGHGGLG